MGFIPSGQTVYAQAYLTEKGRQYIFGNSSKSRFATRPDGTRVDRFLVTHFSLGDPDVNYKIPINLSGGTVPDVSGENETALKGAKGRNLDNIITPGDAFFENEVKTLEYKASNPRYRVDFNKPLSSIPTVFTSQLLTIINGTNTQDGMYTMTPTNYGNNQINENELIIPLKQATANQPGYRMRIFFPSSGSNYNKFSVQFEQGFFVAGTITETYTKTFTPDPLQSGNLPAGTNLQNITIID